MPKLKMTRILPLWLVGLAIAVEVSLLYYFKWSDVHQKAPYSLHVSPLGDKLSEDQADQASESVDFIDQKTITDQVDDTGKESSTIFNGGTLSSAADPEMIFYSLMSVAPDERNQAIEFVIQHAESLYTFDAIYRRIIVLSSDDDPQVAERAQNAGYRLMAMRAAHEIPEAMSISVDEVWSISPDHLEKAVVPFDRVIELALDDSDPAIRLTGIEAAIRQSNENGFDLLWEVVLTDGNPENRLSALGELEQMLKNGLIDGDQISQLLEDTTVDPDSRVSDLSALIIQEQLGQETYAAREQLPQPDENDAWYNHEELSESENMLETTTETIDTIRELALYDPDPAIRLSAIEAAAGQQNGDSFDLLAQVALDGYDADSRLSAVSALENMVTSDTNDSEQILHVLEETAYDPDPRVAELSALIIQEKMNVLEAQSQSGENENIQNDAGAPE